MTLEGSGVQRMDSAQILNLGFPVAVCKRPLMILENGFSNFTVT